MIPVSHEATHDLGDFFEFSLTLIGLISGSSFAQAMIDMGFENASYMAGGMEAWKAAGLPTG